MKSRAGAIFFIFFFFRVIFTGWNHAAFTAFTGIGIAIARLGNRNLAVKLVAPIVGWFIAYTVACHVQRAFIHRELAQVRFSLFVSVGWAGLPSLPSFSLPSRGTCARQKILG